MTIKAVGTVVANRNDGRTIEVEWQPFEQKDWFFFTNMRTIWRLKRGPDYRHWEYSARLIDFIWNGVPQDFGWFCDRWFGGDGDPLPVDEADDVVTTVAPFGVEDMVAAGVFLGEDELRQMVARLRSKKNLILQGAPGVGKTFLARMLAYTLMGEQDNGRVQFVQFHQTYSYEDFVRGYRPLGERAGEFGLQDSVFYKFCKQAEQDPERDHVFVIDEINRGNLSQIFGELLMLIEGDKRGPEHGVELVYQRPGEGRFFVPANVYLVGLMNLADRSLAVVDYALRRRFAFVTLTPRYESPTFRRWLTDRGMGDDLVALIVQRIGVLNHEIRTDPLLGENYEVGHSFFCPRGNDFSKLDREWYEGVIKTEVVPLLKEYWFDNFQRLDQATARLLAQ
jgi:5-methylcytosine-specific restriction protein B